MTTVAQREEKKDQKLNWKELQAVLVENSVRHFVAFVVAKGFEKREACEIVAQHTSR